VHEFHGPHAEAFNHDEPRPKAGAGAGAESAEHDDRRGIESLVPQLGAELPFENIGRHILLVDDLHRQHHHVEIRPSRRRGTDIPAQRSVRLGLRVRIEQNPSQDLVLPIRGNLVRWMGVRPIQRK
jgi:hypothetical protein